MSVPLSSVVSYFCQKASAAFMRRRFSVVTYAVVVASDACPRDSLQNLTLKMRWSRAGVCRVVMRDLWSWRSNRTAYEAGFRPNGARAPHHMRIHPRAPRTCRRAIHKLLSANNIVSRAVSLAMRPGLRRKLNPFIEPEFIAERLEKAKASVEGGR